jgi:hypothetical protein
LIESIGIGEEIERGDRKAKQAGSRFREMFVVASRFRSVIAGVSAMAKPSSGRRYSDEGLVSLRVHALRRTPVSE